MNLKKIVFNQYFIVGLFFLIWMLFFDQNSVKMHWKTNHKLNDLESEALYYKNKIAEEGGRLNKLNSDALAIEKVARQKYFMKKKNEEVFILRKPE